MQNSSSLYLELYNSLSSEELNRKAKANQDLIRLEQAEHSWQIAKDLMRNPNNHIYGCQLLSKKLNRPYTREMENKHRLVEFILAIQHLNNTLYFCLTKIALHLGWEGLQLSSLHNQPIEVIKVLTNFPQAASIIRTEQQIDAKEHAAKIFQKYKPFLMNYVKQYPVEVITCLEAYTQNNYHLNSQEIIIFLLTQPIQKVGQIFETVLLEEKYPNLQQKIFQYLVQNSQTTAPQLFYPVFLSFSRSLNFSLLSSQTSFWILGKILEFMKKQILMDLQERRNVAFISDSFEFWHEFCQSVKQCDQNQLVQLPIFLESLVELWKIIIERSMESQMPEFKQNKADPLAVIIDDDDEDYGIQVVVTSTFRNTAEDYLHMIFEGAKRFPQTQTKCLTILFDLSKSSNPLHLELAVFVLSSIVQFVHENSLSQIATILQSIIENTNAKYPYIWQQLIKLLGKLGHQTICSESIFKTALLVLRESILIEKLSILACESFTDILQTCKNSTQKSSQTTYLKEFFDQIYTSIYFTTTNETLFEKLTKSIFLFLYYFNKNVEEFQKYLEDVNKKIESHHKIEDKLNIIENIAFCHHFIERDASQMFSASISEFIVAFLPVLINSIENFRSKKLSDVLKKIASITSICGGFHSQIWCNAILFIFSSPHLQKNKQELTNICIKFIRIEQFDENYLSEVIEFIPKVEPIITEFLVQSTSQETELINKCLVFHHYLLLKFIQHLKGYNPDTIIEFIVGKLFQSFIKFQYESSRTSLMILKSIISKNYHVQSILASTFKVSNRLADMLWKSFESLLTEAFKQGGENVYKSAFAKVKPALLPPNPLFEALMCSFVESDGKKMKKIICAL